MCSSLLQAGDVRGAQEQITQLFSREQFQRSVELDSTSATAAIAFRQLGYHRLLGKDFAGATPLIERAVTINPKDVQALIWLAQGYQNSLNRTKAMENYQRVLAIDPKQLDALKGVKSLTGGAK